MRCKTRWRPSEASLSGVHADWSARLVAFEAQTGPDGHPLFVADIVGLSRTLTAGAVLPGTEIEAWSVRNVQRKSLGYPRTSTRDLILRLNEEGPLENLPVQLGPLSIGFPSFQRRGADQYLLRVVH